MKAASLESIRKIRLIELPVPTIDKNEILIKVKAAGICGTDLHFYEGLWSVQKPIINGHEFSGEIVETGSDVEGFNIGDKVSADPNMICGTCYYCRHSTKTYLCKNMIATGVNLNGAFAEFVKVNAQNLYKLEKHVDFDEAAMSEPISCCIHGIDKSQIIPGDTVAIIGAGPIGLMMLQLARLCGASVIIISDLIHSKLDVAQKLGADFIVDSSKENLNEVVLEKTNGIGADVVIEAVGNAITAVQSIKIARKGGHIVFFGVAPETTEITISPFDIYKRELTLTSAFTNPFTFSRAIALLNNKKIDVKSIISHQIPLSEIQKAYDMLFRREPGVNKIIIKPESGS